MYTAHGYRALRGLFRDSLLWGNPVIFTDGGKSYNYHGVSPQSVNITGFIHNIHRVSLRFLQPSSINSAGLPCRDPAIPSPRSFHGVKICSAVLSCKKGHCALYWFLSYIDSWLKLTSSWLLKERMLKEMPSTRQINVHKREQKVFNVHFFYVYKNSRF